MLFYFHVMATARNPLLRHAGKLVLALLFLGMTRHAYAETPYNAPYAWAFKWLLGPLVISVILLVFLQKEKLVKKLKSWILIFFLMVFAVMAGMISGAGYINIINTWVANPKQVMIQGTVTEKRESQSPFGQPSKQIRIKNAETGSITTLTVMPDEYTRINVGDIYRRSMTEGLLGYPFSRRWQ